MLTKLLSRKFLVTAGALSSVLLGADIEPLRMAIMGAVAVVYILTEGLLDRARAEELRSAVEQGLAVAQQATAAADPASRDQGKAQP